MDRLNLGCGARPMVGYLNHDRTMHSDWVDMKWDLEDMPWPWMDEEWDEVRADDVFEHLFHEVDTWLDEVWRILRPSGTLDMRLPAFDNHLSYRDPTHRRVFHPETFFFWDPRTNLYQDFGRYYYDANKLWAVTYSGKENGDLRFRLVKTVEPS